MPSILQHTISIAVRILPSLPLVVVHGWRDDEENALRVAALAAATVRPGARVYLLCENPAQSRKLLANATARAEHPAAAPRFVRKNSARGVLLFVFARVAFYTHGLFGNPASGAGRLHVLLGHGHGPKSASPRIGPFEHRADLATSNNAAWGGQVVRDQGIGDALVLTGNPREDAFAEPRDREALRRLGLDPERPLIAWLPTYRSVRTASSTPWTDGVALSETAGMAEAVAALVEHARTHGVTLVAKSHLFDLDETFRGFGVRVLTNHELADAGISFYQFLAATDAIVSDYSSVWVDYLVSGRSVGLLFRDHDVYATRRGFNTPTLADVASDLFLSGTEEIASFIESVAQGTVWHDEERAALAAALGVVGRYSRTEAVVSAAEALATRRRLAWPLRAPRR